MRARGAALPSLKPLDVLLRATAEIGSEVYEFRGCGLNGYEIAWTIRPFNCDIDSGMATVTLNRPDKRNAISYRTD